MTKSVDVVVFVQVPAGLSLREIEAHVLMQIARGQAEMRVNPRPGKAPQR